MRADPSRPPETAGARRSAARVCALLLALLLLGGGALCCATAPSVNAWHQHLLDADRYYDHGELERARATYAALLPMAPERQLARYVRLRIALIDGYSGELERAIEQLSALELEPNPEHDELQSKARLAMAVLLEEVGEQPQAALELYVDIVVRYPDSMAGADALEAVLDTFESQDDPGGAVAWLAEAWPPLSETELGDKLLYAMARIFDEDLDDPETAGELYQQVRTLYRDEALADDATLRLARVLVRLERFDEALTILETLAGPHDSSWSMGEYDTKLRDDAMLLRAELFERLGRPADAIDEYQRLLDAFPSHSEGGRISWHRAELVRTATGDLEQYREALDALVETFFHSIYAERATWRLELLEQGVPLDELERHPMPRAKPWLDDGDAAP